MLKTGDDFIERQPAVEQSQDEVLLVAELIVVQGDRILDRPIRLAPIFNGDDLQIPPDERIH